MELVDRLFERHGGRVEFCGAVPTKVGQKADFRCSSCGRVWSTVVDSVLNQGTGCRSCSQTARNYQRRKSLEPSIRSALAGRDIHLLGPYSGQRVKAKFECGVCYWQWITTPGSVLNNGTGCPSCAGNARLTAEQYRKKVHASTQGKVECVEAYVSAGKPICHRCTRCTHVWRCAPYSILGMGTGCPRCNRSAVSPIATRWLNDMERWYRLKIEREVRIQGTLYTADGFNRHHQVVFEFNGDCYHGNPRRFAPDSYPNHFAPRKTARELYASTLAKERALRRLGFIVVSLWEMDYRALRPSKKAMQDFLQWTPPRRDGIQHG